MARMSPVLQEIDAPYLLALKQELQDAYGPQDEQIRRSREVRELRRATGVKADWRLVDAEIHDAAYTAQTFQATSTLTAQFPTVQVAAVPETQAAQENATERERWTQEVFRLAGEQQHGPHTLSRLVDGAVSDGGGWTKFVHWGDAWAEVARVRPSQYADDDGYDALDPEASARRGARSGARKYREARELARQLAKPPFRWQYVDPLTVYPLFEGDEIAAVLEVTERPLRQTFRRYRLARSRSGDLLLPEEVAQGVPVGETRDGALSGTVHFLEYWDADSVAYCVTSRNFDGGPTGKVVKTWKHRYGRHPYFPAYGLFMSHWRNRKVGWGVGESMRELVELRSFLWTLLANLAARDTFPILQEVVTHPELALQDPTRARVPTTELWQLRQILRNRLGRRLEVLGMPGVAEALKVHLATVDAAIERLEAPRFTGDIGGLEGAGFAISEVLNDRDLRFRPITQGVELTLKELARFTWSLVRHKVRAPVPIYAADQKGKRSWLRLGPDELNDTVHVKVLLQYRQPGTELVLQRMVHEAIREGTMSWSQGVELLGRNPDEVRRGRRLDQLRQGKLYQALADQALLAELGRGDLEALALEVEGLVQSGVVPGMPPDQVAQVEAARAAGQGGSPAAIDGTIVQDPGRLTAAPGGAGAFPAGAPSGGGGGPGSGQVMGAPASVGGQPFASAAAAAQNQVIPG